MINDALESLVTAVESERADVIQEVVKTVKKCKYINIFNSELVTLFHHSPSPVLLNWLDIIIHDR